MYALHYACFCSKGFHKVPWLVVVGVVVVVVVKGVVVVAVVIE